MTPPKQEGYFYAHTTLSCAKYCIVKAQLEYIKTTFPQLLQAANKDKSPNWGRMDFQQMVEHLILSFKNANGSLPASKIISPAENLEKLRAFLMSDKEFRENTKSPALPDEPFPHRFATVEKAIEKLISEINKWEQIYESTPNLTILNPVFGELNFEESIQLLYKHCRHHARQFGLE